MGLCLKYVKKILKGPKSIKNKINVIYQMKKNNAPKSCIFHPSLNAENTEFEGNNFIRENVKIINSKIGFGTYIAQNSKLYNCSIGKYCAIGFESMIGAHPVHKIASIHPALYSTKNGCGFTYTKKDSFQEYVYADEKNKFSIVIGNDVWVTAGSTKIIQNIKIGDGAIVMLDAVVTKDVPPYAIVAGIPAKIIGYRFEPDEIDFLLKLKWWNRSEEWIRNHADYFEDIKLLKKVVLEEEPDLI